MYMSLTCLLDSLATIFLIMGGIIFLAAIIFIIVFASTRSSEPRETRPRRETPSFTLDHGKRGENLVAKYLTEIVNDYGGYLFNNFCFEDEKEFSSEIDHILVTRGGLFIIETKTIKGKVYGDENQDEWTVVKENYPQKRIKNPLIQNRGHINHLRKVLPSDSYIGFYSIIIFPTADVKNVESDNVFSLGGAIDVIREIAMTNKYSNEIVETINQELKTILERYGISQEKHLENIHKKYGN